MGETKLTTEQCHTQDRSRIKKEYINIDALSMYRRRLDCRSGLCKYALQMTQMSHKSNVTLVSIPLTLQSEREMKKESIME